MKKKNGFTTQEMLVIVFMSATILAILGLVIFANIQGSTKDSTKEKEETPSIPVTPSESETEKSTVEISEFYKTLAYAYITSVNYGVFSKMYEDPNVSFTDGTFDGKTYTGTDGTTETIDIYFESANVSDVSLHITNEKVDGGTIVMEGYTFEVSSDGTITLIQGETTNTTKVKRSDVALAVAKAYVKSVEYETLVKMYEDPNAIFINGTFDGKTYTSEDGTTIELQITSMAGTPSSVFLTMQSGAISSGTMTIDGYSIKLNLGIFTLN